MFIFAILLSIVLILMHDVKLHEHELPFLR